MKKVKIHIDGNDYEAEEGKNLLHTCLALGFNIPYFCYHPAFGSVGACRQCAVKKYRNTDDKRGRIIMSCMEPVAEGLIISTDDPEVIDFRKSIIEALMTNHPHDCPVCDEGGECHLQDMTVMTGHNYRRFGFRKRTYLNQDLGPYINHEMNRCIQCYRCVRFYRDYAGGSDLHVFGSAAHVYFGRHSDGMLESIFSGNLVEVCPTGVFTDKTLSNHYTRKWDLTNSPSICTKCSVGCNIIIGERYGNVRRVRSRYNYDVNGYFICDRGRFDYEYINSPDRVKDIRINTTRSGNSRDKDEKDSLLSLRNAVKGKNLTGVGSPTASLESNFALQMLVGKENFYNGVPPEESSFVREAIRIMKDGRFYSPSLKDIEKCDAILILGDDPLISAPMLALAIRQATRNKSFDIAARAGIPGWNDAAVRDIGHNEYSPLIIASHSGSALKEIATCTIEGSDEDIGDFGNKIAGILSKPELTGNQPDNSKNDPVSKAAALLFQSKNPLIVAGSATSNPGILKSAEKICQSLVNPERTVSCSIIFNSCNSLGLGLLEGKDIDYISKNKSEKGTLIILENDIYKNLKREKAEEIINGFERIIVIDHSSGETSFKADIFLPSGTFAESTGTIINNEGRAQRYYRVLPQDSNVKDSWKWISEIIRFNDQENNWYNFDDVSASFSDFYPFYSIINESFPRADTRYTGDTIPRQFARFSGRTAMNANINVHEPKPPQDSDSPLSFSMEGYRGVAPSCLTPEYLSPGWNSAQAINKSLREPGGKYIGEECGVRLFEKKKT
ncbi:MAG TPA: NADH-quinone oxidoreductase subunit NuoG [Bacteroidales bacterium]|nr:NADH-quinone oxidoreductase subunit NuoG [Bacteroidales bacterium]